MDAMATNYPESFNNGAGGGENPSLKVEDDGPAC